MGTALVAVGRHEEGLDALRGSLELYRDLPGAVQDQADCLYDTGVALRAAGRHEEAAASFRQALDLYRKVGGTGRQQAVCLYRAGSEMARLERYEEVQEAFQDAVALYPGLREEFGQDEGTLRTAWSAWCFARERTHSRRFRRCL